MPNIIRIRNLEEEFNLDDIIIPVDKDDYTEVGKQVSVSNLKDWILSGFTGGTMGSSGTSGLDGIDGIDGTNGTSGTSPCTVLQSNSITIIVNQCYVDGIIECVI